MPPCSDLRVIKHMGSWGRDYSISYRGLHDRCHIMFYTNDITCQNNQSKPSHWLLGVCIIKHNQLLSITIQKYHDTIYITIRYISRHKLLHDIDLKFNTSTVYIGWSNVCSGVFESCSLSCVYGDTLWDTQHTHITADKLCGSWIYIKSCIFSTITIWIFLYRYRDSEFYIDILVYQYHYCGHGSDWCEQVSSAWRERLYNKASLWP